MMMRSAPRVRRTQIHPQYETAGRKKLTGKKFREGCLDFMSHWILTERVHSVD